MRTVPFKKESGYSTKELILDASAYSICKCKTVSKRRADPFLEMCLIYLCDPDAPYLAGAFGMGLFDCRLDCMGTIYICDRRCYGLCSWCYDRRTPQHSKRCGSDRCSLCDQSSWLLYCRSDPVSQPVCSGCFYSWKPGADRYSSCDRSDLCRAASVRYFVLF